MTALSHLLRSPSAFPRSAPQPPSGSRRRRVLAGLAVSVALLAVAVPLGLRGVGAGSSAPDSGASEGAVPGSVQGSGSSSAGAATAAPGAQPGAQSGARSASPSAGTGAGTGDGLGDSGVVVGPKISRTAWLGLKVTDLAGAAARARVVATEAGGQVTSEDVVTSVDPTGGLLGGAPNGSTTGRPDASSSGAARSSGAEATQPGVAASQVGVDQARMVLNVPAKALDEVLTQLSRLGSVSYRSSQSQDVTDTYVDTRSRIQPMRDGIERLRALLARTTDLQQVITLETELSRRQAELDSLTQRLAQLDAMTTTSDVTVSMWTDTTPPAQPGDGLSGGFSGGLHSAWDSLLGSLTVVLTGLAALLPWLLVLVPLALLALRLRRRRTAGAPTSSRSSGSAD